MWKSTMLVLSVVSTVSSYSWFRGFNSPTLNPPTSLKVGFISHEAVLVQWDFKLPANLTLNEVVFVARLDSALCIFDLYRPCWERSFKFQEFPLIRRLSALFPGTFYTFYVTATHRNWRDSQSGWISFTTRKQDWPTPELASLNRTHRNDVAEYEVRWKEFSRSKLRLLLVEVCQTNCIVYSQPPEAAVALVPMKFNTKYAIRTIAVYSEDLVGDIQRYTDYTTGVSAREPPENLLSDELRYEVEENRLKLPWHPLLPYTGPKSYYEIMVTAPSLRSTDTGALIEAEEPGFSLIPSPKIRDALEIRFEKVREYRERSRAEKAIRLNVVSRSQSVVTLRIVFMQVPESDLDAELPAKFLLLGPSVAEVFDFLHYEPIYFTVCNCLYTMKPRQTSCGNRTGYDVWSRVYVPEPVAHIGVRHREDEAIEFFWRMPEKPRGPIDGFHAWTHHHPNGLLYTLEGGKEVCDDDDLHEEMTFDRYTRSFIGNKSIKAFAVAAFNIDKDDNNKKLVSEYETVAAHTTDIETSAIPFLFLAVALLAVILLPCCLLICSRLGRVHDVHEDGIQHIAMDHDPIVIVNGVLNHHPVHAEAFL